ncbi:hypothetical protein ACROYT_G020144 [Oculina patagonica]
MKRVKIAMILLLAQCLTSVTQGQANNDEAVQEVCSSYSFRRPRNTNWIKATEECKKHGGRLVSMETEEEWKHVKAMARTRQGRWFIGLRNISTSRKWCWLSDNTSCINATLSKPSSWRWNMHEPNNLNSEKCVEMLNNGDYNNVGCEIRHYYGFICENHENCTEVSKLKKDIFFSKTIIKKTTTPKPLTTKKKSSIPVDTNYLITKPEVQHSIATKGVSMETGSSSAQSNSSLIMILVIVLAVVVGILLAVLAYIIWRKKVFKTKGRKRQSGNLESTGVETQTAHAMQNFHDRAQYQRNSHEMVDPDDFSTQTEAIEMANLDYTYAVVRNPKKNPTPSSAGVSAPPQQHLSTFKEEVTLATSASLSQSLKDENYVYANVELGLIGQRKSEASKPSPATAKKPEEHTDRRDGKQDYLYAVVDKARKKKKNDEDAFGTVYAVLDFA